MTVKADESIIDVAARAVARPVASRWEPVVCVDLPGRYAGIVGPERLGDALISCQQGEIR